MPTTKRPPRPMNLAEQLGHGPVGQQHAERQQRRAGRAERMAARSAARAERAAAPGRPAFPPHEMLSAADRERCMQALGIVPTDVVTMVAAVPYAPPPDATVSRKLADQFVEQMGRYRQRADRDRREAELAQLGPIDASSAKPEDLSARLTAMGINDPSLRFEAPARPLEPPPSRAGQQAASNQAEVDRQVALAVRAAIARGQRVDARRLSPGELRALTELGLA